MRRTIFNKHRQSAGPASFAAVWAAEKDGPMTGSRLLRPHRSADQKQTDCPHYLVLTPFLPLSFVFLMIFCIFLSINLFNQNIFCYFDLLAGRDSQEKRLLFTKRHVLKIVCTSTTVSAEIAELRFSESEAFPN